MATVDMRGARLSARALLAALQPLWDERGPMGIPRIFVGDLFVLRLFRAWGAQDDREFHDGFGAVRLETDMGDVWCVPLLGMASGLVELSDRDHTVYGTITNFSTARADYPELLSDQDVREVLDRALRLLDEREPGLRLAALQAAQ